MEGKISNVKLNSAFIEGLSHSDEDSLTTENFKPQAFLKDSKINSL